MSRFQKKLTSAQIIILGFAGIILLGSLLLMLPIATVDGESASFIDALFTSTSAVCVTGLIVHDTATYWSLFGQVVILCLIQIGGMGVVTMAIAISMVSGKRIGLKQRSIMQESIAAPKVGGIVKLTGFIVKMTIIFEAAGAILMAPTFIKEFGGARGLWYSIFHSISAFCNAGFDLMGIKEQYSSLTFYVNNPMINIAITSLIIVGGIGFITWEDIAKNRWHIKQYRMQSKVVLTTTIILIVFPTIYFFMFEFTSLPLGERILSSLFQAVTPRTAGFNTVNLGALSEVAIAMIISLMLIGGSPGSTAGGMKTTTFAVMISNTISVFRRREHTQFYGRRVAESVIRNAATIATMYITLCLVGGCVISYVEQLPLLTCLFESASAVGTVGLTLGITPNLHIVSRMVLIALMYIGRVGGLTLIFATIHSNQTPTAKLPEEKMTVG